MTCYHPIVAYKDKINKSSNNKQLIVFKKGGSIYEEIKLPCGNCIGCRIARSRSWALRCVHEASLYQNNCFITLTFNDENLNENQTLVKSDFQNFMKRLRDKYCGLESVDGYYPIRYFHCGEYGSELNRPHHHACIFNFDFMDKELWNIRDNVRLYRSEALEKLWPFGYCTVGDVTYESAAYVARYVMKKVTGKMAKVHYCRVDVETGECYDILPEYVTMSRRPGIAKRWFDKYKEDLFSKDFITHNGMKHNSPKYYDKLYDIINPLGMEKIKKKRVDEAEKNADNNSKERLEARETVLSSKVKSLIRSI